MKASVNWINSYLQNSALAANQIEDLLTFAGLPIDSQNQLPPTSNSPKGDCALEVEVTSNRGDCLCHVGLAREIAAVTGMQLLAPSSKSPNLPIGSFTVRNEIRSAPSTSQSVSIPSGFPNGTPCPSFSLTILSNAKIGPSPAWLAERLEAIGQRSINNAVDATNFVLHELGIPSHVFDADKIDGKTLTIRHATKGEALALLDGRTITLGGHEMVIADNASATRPISLAGVMGGSLTAVSTSTTNIALEVATWDPVLVRLAARRHATRTDSSYRYERIVDPRMLAAGRNRLISLLVELTGATPVSLVEDANPLAAQTTITLRHARIAHVLGISLGSDEVQRILTVHGMTVTMQTGPSPDAIAYVVAVPPHRPDLKLEIDLIEELARTRGYDKLHVPEMLPVRVAAAQTSERARREIHRVLTGLGFFEAITFSFCTAPQAKPFLKPGQSLVKVSDDRRGDDNVCRPSALAGLLTCRKNNQDAAVDAGQGGMRLFETAAVFAQSGDAKTPTSHERRTLALLLDAPTSGSAFEKKQAAIRAIKGVAEHLVTTLGGIQARITVSPAQFAPPAFEPSTVAAIAVNDIPLGMLGLISQPTQAAFGLLNPVVAAELDLAELVALYPPKTNVAMLPTMPAIERDLSVIIKENITWQAVERTLLDLKAHNNLPNLESYAFLMTYRGNPIPTAHKSLSLRMTFRDQSRTLRDEDVHPQVGKLVEALEAGVGAKLRTQ